MPYDITSTWNLKTGYAWTYLQNRNRVTNLRLPEGRREQGEKLGDALTETLESFWSESFCLFRVCHWHAWFFLDFLEHKEHSFSNCFKCLSTNSTSVWFSDLLRACSCLSSSLHKDSFLPNERHHGSSPWWMFLDSYKHPQALFSGTAAFLRAV